MKESEAVEQVSRIAVFWPGTPPATIAAYAAELIGEDVRDLETARHTLVAAWTRDRLPPVALVREHVRMAKRTREEEEGRVALPVFGSPLRYWLGEDDPEGPYMPEGWIPPEPWIAQWHDQDPNGPKGTKLPQGRYLTRREFDDRMRLLREGLDAGLRGRKLLEHTRHGLPA